MHRVFSSRASLLSLGFATVVVAGSLPETADACVYAGKVATFNRAVVRWRAHGSPALPNGIANAVCKARRKIECKFKNKPGKPVPPIPDDDGDGMPDLACPPKNNGGGRGGGPGGGAGPPGGPGGGGAGPGGPPGGSPIAFPIWIRNHYSFPVNFSWVISPSPAVPGFSIGSLSGSLMVAGTSTDSFANSATIAGSVVAPLDADFVVTITDPISGLPLADEFEQFKVSAVTSGITVVPTTPVVTVGPKTAFTVSWDVTNTTGSTLMLPYTILQNVDPESVMELNDGTAYDVANIFKKDKSLGSGSVSIPPSSTVTVTSPLMVRGEYCDPEMLTCKALEIGGFSTCVFIVNDEAGPDYPVHSNSLRGVPQGGTVDVDLTEGANVFNVSVPTSPGQTLEEIIDQLATEILNNAETVNGFDYVPLVDGNTISILRSPNTIVELSTTDPGLTFAPLVPALGSRTLLVLALLLLLAPLSLRRLRRLRTAVG